jgi:hypothetical protein
VLPEAYSGNITHNLGPMAKEVGIYRHLWRPEELGITHSRELVKPLELGLKELKSNPEKYEKLNPENGWGSYDGLCRFVEEYLTACRENPDCIISVWR